MKTDEGFIKVEISRRICDYGVIAFVLKCETHRIKRAYDGFDTLRELKNYYNIKKVHKTNKKEGGKSPTGLKREWGVYEAYVFSDYVI